MRSSISIPPVGRPHARSRSAWLVAGLLLLAAGILTAASHLVFWAPCFGAGASPTVCTQRSASWLSPPFMADPPDRLPWVTGTAAVGSFLAGLSWPMAMRALSLGRIGRLLGLLVAAQTVSIGLWSVVSAFTSLIDPELPVPPLWWVGGELAAAALVLLVMFEFEEVGRSLLEVVWGAVALIGATTFGMLRFQAELLVFGGSLGDGAPDPGAGFGLAAALLLSGVALVVRYRLLAPERRAASPHLVGRPA